MVAITDAVRLVRRLRSVLAGLSAGGGGHGATVPVVMQVWDLRQQPHPTPAATAAERVLSSFFERCR